MPKMSTFETKIRKYVYVTISLLYLMASAGFDKTLVGLGLAICYYLLYRF